MQMHEIFVDIQSIWIIIHLIISLLLSWEGATYMALTVLGIAQKEGACNISVNLFSSVPLRMSEEEV